MTEVNAKFRYVQLCRSLKTYGITSFAVKIQLKKKKFADAYLGITRDAIHRMDSNTREIQKSYKLEHLRRWAAAQQSLTLDFGDFEEDYVVMQTKEASAISQLIAGYIDIILKARSDATTLTEDDDSSVAQVESVAPIRAQATRAGTASMAASHGMARASPGMVGGAQQGYITNNNKPASQQVRINDMASAMRANSLLNDELANPSSYTMAKSNLTPEQLRAQLLTHQNAVLLGGKDLLEQCSKDPNDLDPNGVLNAAKGLMANMGHLGATAKAAAVSGKEVDQNLLNSARSVSDAIAALLESADNLVKNPHNPGFRDDLELGHAGLLNASKYLNAAVAGEMTDQASQEMLLAAARATASAIADLVQHTNTAAKSLTDGKQMKDLLAGHVFVVKRKP